MSQNVIVKIASVFLLLLAVISVFSLRLQFNSLKEQRDQLTVSIEALEEDIEKIEKKLASELDDAYVVEIAKDKLNLRLPDEIIFYNDLTD